MKKAAILIMTIGIIFPMIVWGDANRITDKIPQVPEQVESIENLQLKITVSDRELTATFVDSKTTREFIKMLPLTLSLDDLGKREKYSNLPQELSKEGIVKTTFQKGDISYWLGGGIAAFYNQDNHEVKAGLIVMAKLEKGIDLFSGPNSLKVKFEAVKKK